MSKEFALPLLLEDNSIGHSCHIGCYLSRLALRKDFKKVTLYS